MVLVEITEGIIKGKVGEDARGGRYYSFQGVPYAAPPIGPLRFKAPKPPIPWKGVKDAIEEGNNSYSRDLLTKKVVGSEDCLFLNVYTPEIQNENQRYQPLRPVMFFIHGGILKTGSSRADIYGPEFLIAEDVVLVTINYRLGYLGYLSLDDSSLGVPGNAGFKDMVMALKWVQRNIEQFCGDPNNVTLFGESAGGAAAHLIMLSPMAKGLFHKIILQSSSALNQWIYGRRSASLLAEKLGFSSTDDRKLLEFLQKTPVEDILKTQSRLDAVDFMEMKYRIFGVIVERPSDEEPFLTHSPLELILSGNYHHVPMIMGYNSCEGLMFDEIIKPQFGRMFLKNFELWIPVALNIEKNTPKSREIARKIKDYYFPGIETPTREEHSKEFFLLATDYSFVREIYSSAKNQCQTSKFPIYFYKHSLESKLNIFKEITGNTFPGVAHLDDLPYLFKTIFTPEIEPNSIEDIGQRRFTKMWANFARYGNPTPISNDELLNITWQPMEKNNFRYLEIGETLQMRSNQEEERMKFWDEVYQYNSTTSKL